LRGCYPAPFVTAIASLVAADASLRDLTRRLEESPQAPLPLDTEADSFHHYFEKVCLMQLAADGTAFVVDPLAGLDLAPLFSCIAGKTLLMHGADYDLRLLNRGYGFRARAVFDTMLAAQLLGEKEIGLAAQLQRRVGVTLDKTLQRADWSARPLGPQLLAYAASDVLHLQELVASLSSDLESKGRLSWHAEECARLVAAPFSARQADPENDWRLKGTNSLSGRERAFVKALWEAREGRAQEMDRPAFRVLTNDRLLHASSLAAKGETNLSKLFPRPRAMPGGLERTLNDALAKARALPPEQWPGPRRNERTESEPALEREVEKLKKKRDERAKQLALEPGIVASRAALTAAARLARAKGRLTVEDLVAEAGLSRWRAELLAT
jgi:ribonuclease D